MEATEALQCESSAFIKKIPKPYKVEGRGRVEHTCGIRVLSLITCSLLISSYLSFYCLWGRVILQKHIKQEDCKYVLIHRMPL